MDFWRTPFQSNQYVSASKCEPTKTPDNIDQRLPFQFTSTPRHICHSKQQRLKLQENSCTYRFMQFFHSDIIWPSLSGRRKSMVDFHWFNHTTWQAPETNRHEVVTSDAGRASGSSWLSISWRLSACGAVSWPVRLSVLYSETAETPKPSMGISGS